MVFMSIVRWTIGNVSKQGFLCLKKSIHSFAKVYGTNFDFYVCFNSIAIHELDHLLSLEFKVTLLEQKQLFIDGYGSVWKYSPPRLDLNQKELILDNDIVFFKKTKEIERFFVEDRLLIAQDNCRFYGRYEPFVSGMINAGIIGLPVGFDFSKELLKNWSLLKFQDLNSADEQGLTAMTISSCDPICIPFNKIPIVHSKGIAVECFTKWTKYKWDSDAIHFVGLNAKSHHYYNQLVKLQ